MKQTNRTQPSGARRAFLKGAAAAGATVGAAAALAHAPPETPAETAAEPGDSRNYRNYRESAHIRAYYRAARF